MFLIKVLKYIFPHFYHRIRQNSFFNKRYFIQHCIIHMLYLESDDDLESTHKPYIEKWQIRNGTFTEDEIYVQAYKTYIYIYIYTDIFLTIF